MENYLNLTRHRFSVRQGLPANAWHPLHFPVGAQGGYLPVPRSESSSPIGKRWELELRVATPLTLAKIGKDRRVDILAT